MTGIQDTKSNVIFLFQSDFASPQTHMYRKPVILEIFSYGNLILIIYMIVYYILIYFGELYTFSMDEKFKK